MYVHSVCVECVNEADAFMFKEWLLTDFWNEAISDEVVFVAHKDDCVMSLGWSQFLEAALREPERTTVRDRVDNEESISAIRQHLTKVSTALYRHTQTPNISTADSIHSFSHSPSGHVEPIFA